MLDACIKRGFEVSFKRVKKLATQYTVALVFVMGMLSTFSLLMRPSSIELSHSPSQADRAPTSLKAATQIKFDNEVEVIQFDCSRASYNLGNISQVRIKGRLCGQKSAAKLHNSDIRNLATGLNATVFFAKENDQFTTDFIQLKKGENKIAIDHTLDDGTIDHSEISVRVE